jgi:hypothetical protein
MPSINLRYNDDFEDIDYIILMLDTFAELHILS